MSQTGMWLTRLYYTLVMIYLVAHYEYWWTERSVESYIAEAYLFIIWFRSTGDTIHFTYMFSFSVF